MADKATTGDDISSPKPPLEHRIDEQRPPGRESTAETKDKIDLAIERQLEHARSLDEKHRVAKLEAEAKAKALKDLGLKPGDPVSTAVLPLTRELAERAVRVLKSRRLKAGEFQESMGFFNAAKLAPVRKALVAAGVTAETAEGSVVFIELTQEFIGGDTK